MGRKAVDLEPYKGNIISLYQAQSSVDSIREFLINKNVKVSKRTLEARLQEWEDKELLDLQTDTILRALLEEAEKGVIQGYGKEMLHRYMCSQGHILARDCLFSTYRMAFPEAIERQYIIPGPNFIWSVDGYLKLEPYGIEIYAAMDAYSRYIIWIYSVSVLSQYLNTLDLVKKQPLRIRSDCGSEIGLFKQAHIQLRQLSTPNIQPNDCWILGRIIRAQVSQFIHTWNIHRIRAQKNRPNSVAGKPYLLYHYPDDGVLDYGSFIQSEALETLKREVEEFEKVQVQLNSRTILSFNDFITQDLLPLLNPNGHYIQESGDSLQLATSINKKSPIFISPQANKAQALDDLLKYWFSSHKSSTGEKLYHIYVIIERTIFDDKREIKEEAEDIFIKPSSPLSSGSSYRTRRTHTLDDEDRERIAEYGPFIKRK
ncbi:hypothetical protein P175DRAFT_0507447 [Aspergillus ochraceoroseus IBT 24754]|uniref:Integrase core domain-containing protein n=1 Tax=Aspergillus ochraceoroseus IBT 24754 TaxID=1392256 RepID=A0A2T5M270_9EURO|nr:uncharacterized protein P175DRAFT_0507447 [Aspergillus ochraceoroseus IBT 24754]PTU22632.1 hypothetical protein P175DRAFT_0507447 [Aspergillus ochraceoroseus IBT 24754]